MRYFSVRLIGAAVAAALLSTPALAAEYTGTLKKIKDSGTIVLGHRDASIPFSYLGNDPSQPIGYSHDLQLKVVEALKKELKLPSLKVKYNLVTSQTRIPLVQNGTVDLECGSTTNNLERQKQVDFSVGIFEIGTRLLTKKTVMVKFFETPRSVFLLPCSARKLLAVDCLERSAVVHSCRSLRCIR